MRVCGMPHRRWLASAAAMVLLLAVAPVAARAATVAASSNGVAFTAGAGEPSTGAAGEGALVTNIENVNGGSGNDTLLGNASANVWDGGPGDDRLDGRAGPDRLVGGAGFDIADYSSRSEPLRLVLDNTP